MQRLPFSCVVLLMCAGGVFAQSVDSDRCTVWAEPVVYVSPDAVRVTANSMKLLGTFDTVVSVDLLTSKVYRLPRTKLFVIASVQYLENALAEQNPGLISMSLVVSSKRRDDLLARVEIGRASCRERV
jgi:hypothetical protein